MPHNATESWITLIFALRNNGQEHLKWSESLYKHIYDYRKERTGGGVSLFIKNGIEYVKRDDLSVFNNYIESLFIEVTNMKSSSGRTIVVGVIYRPPDQDINEFSITMSTMLVKLKSEKKSYLPIRWLQY